MFERILILFLLFLSTSARSQNSLSDEGYPEILLENTGTFYDSGRQLKWIVQVSKLSETGPVPWEGIPIKKRDADQIKPKPEDFDLVYQIYEEAGGRRSVLSPEFIQRLRQEDIALPGSRIMLFRFKGNDGRVHAQFSLFDGTKYRGDRDSELPLERKYSQLNLRYRKQKNLPIFEIRRLVKKNDVSQVNLEIIARTIIYHMRWNLKIKDYVLYVHTDKLGARYYKRLGFDVEFDPNQIGSPEEYILSISGKTILEKYRSGSFKDGYVEKYKPLRCSMIFN